MWKRLVERYDMMVYRLAYRSLNRMFQRGNGGFAYVLELSLRKWRAEHPLPPELQNATERFFETQTGVRLDEIPA